MKTWSLLAAVAGLLLLAGFSLMAFPPLPAKSPPRSGLTVHGSEVRDPLTSGPARRPRMPEQTSWRQFFIQ